MVIHMALLANSGGFVAAFIIFQLPIKGFAQRPESAPVADEPLEPALSVEVPLRLDEFLLYILQRLNRSSMIS
jgi:hypothetical protein